MNPEIPKSREELEVRLTALLLGELPSDEAFALGRAIEKDAELARVYARLKETVGFVRETVVGSQEQPAVPCAPLKLSNGRREKLRAHFKTVCPKELSVKTERRTSWVVPLAAAAIVLLLAVITLPNFVKSRTTSQSNSILNNLRQLDGAKQQWAFENRKSENDQPTMNDLRPYLKSGFPSVAGEKYIVGKVDEPVVADLKNGETKKLFSDRAERNTRVNFVQDGQLASADKNLTVESGSLQASGHTGQDAADFMTTAPSSKLAMRPIALPTTAPANGGIALKEGSTNLNFFLTENHEVRVGIGGSAGIKSPGTPPSLFDNTHSKQGNVGLADRSNGTSEGVQTLTLGRAPSSSPVATIALPSSVSGKVWNFPAEKLPNVGLLGGVRPTEQPGVGGAGGGVSLATLNYDKTTFSRAVLPPDDKVIGSPDEQAFRRRYGLVGGSSPGQTQHADSAGKPIDPATGLPGDPSTIPSIDPATGLPVAALPGARQADVHLSEKEKAPEFEFDQKTLRGSALSTQSYISSGQGLVEVERAWASPPTRGKILDSAKRENAETTLNDNQPLFQFGAARSDTPNGRSEASDNTHDLKVVGYVNVPVLVTNATGVPVNESLNSNKTPPIGLTGITPILGNKRVLTNQSAEEKEKLEETKLRPAKPAAEAQPEIQTGANPYSTFSLNVSDVSFKLAAASLEKGQMPKPASIRSEEFINAFDYRDPEAVSGVPVAFAWERARYPFAHNRDLLRFSIKTAAAGRQAGRPLNIVLLLDNSGSMERADRVQIIREALRVLASQLQPQDKLSVVTFARTARLWVDGVAGDQAGKVAEEVSGLTPQGGTNLEEAMNLAYQTAARHYLPSGINRVVLLTDGAANLGDVAPESLKQNVEAQRKQGIALDCFGIGWEGFNDDLLEALSRNGDGRYGFINTAEETATEFAGQLAGALRVAASDVKVQVEFNPKRVSAYRQIGYAKHQLTKEQFRDNTVDAAALGAAESGNALYVIETNPAGEGPIATVRVRFKVPGTSDYREHEWAVPFTGNAVPLEQGTSAMRLAATASAFSEWLVSSPYAAEVTPDRLLGYLSGVSDVYGADGRPKKLEWMIREAKRVVGK